MHLKQILGTVCAVGLMVSAAAVAVQPTTEPTTRTARARPIRLTVPWNKVADLTDEQKTQINAIHVETIAQIKALEAAEDEKCMALLTEEQRKTLTETLEKEKVAQKAKAGQKE